ncbi:concanavalin A-like lectin/glucanase domain-containing protein [Sporodiniella umbellata]|nr:concanavalin A-like lectin/glucanase domain-containing protein [Sporodiniella umbellata]
MNYSSAFPPLQAFPWAFTSVDINKEAPFKQQNSPHNTAISNYPAYLKHTNYSQLVAEQHNSRLIESVDLRLPKIWNKNDKAKHIDIGMSGYDLYYSGPGKKELDFSGIRTSLPIKPQCGIYYFEIKITSKGEDGFIFIGLGKAVNRLERVNGARDIYSYTFRGDDGCIYESNENSKKYGSTFSTNDVVGCCLNYAEQKIFFTKNGTSLGPAFEGINTTGDFYPFIGLRTPGEKVYVNFGQEPFLFDITLYVKEIKQKTMQSLLIQDQSIKNDGIDLLVLDYLVHHGYVESANALQKNMQSCNKENSGHREADDSTEIQMRASIRRFLLAGRVCEAISQIDAIFPSLLENNKHLLFQLKVQKFVEMIKDSFQQSNYGLQHQILHEQENLKYHRPSVSTPPQTPVSPVAPGRRVSWAAIAASSTHSPTFTRRSSNASSVHSLDYIDEEHSFVKRATSYGRKLQEKYSENPEYRTIIADIFSLLTCSDITLSPMAHVLSKSTRDSLASDVNAAIQLYQNKQETSCLEKLYKQIVVTIEQLSLSGHGQATLVQPGMI